MKGRAIRAEAGTDMPWPCLTILRMSKCVDHTGVRLNDKGDAAFMKYLPVRPLAVCYAEHKSLRGISGVAPRASTSCRTVSVFSIKV